MTFPTLKSEKSSKRSNSRSRSRSRSNRKRTRKHRNRNKRNNDNNNGNNSRMNNNNNNNNNNFNNKMEIDSDDSNHSLLSSPINELNLTESASISSYTSSTSSLLSLSSSTPAPCSSNIVRGKNRKRHRRRNRNKRKLKIVNNNNNNNNNNNEDTMKVSKEQCQQIEQQQNENEMKEQREPEKEEELVQEEKVETIDDIQEDAEEEQQEEAEEAEEEEEEELREFRFDIKDDSNLRDIINNNLNRENLNDIGLLPTNINSTQTHTGMNIDDDIITNSDELTSEYILSKLYNYMKISEMSKYGISVFKMTFTSYLPYLTESDLNKLATSYWCNGQHFKCMIAHRGDLIKTNPMRQQRIMSIFDDDEQDINNDNNTNNKSSRLQLKISSDLLDAAMQSGASVDKIEAMLLQKRIDEGINNKKLMKKHTNNNNQNQKYHKDGKPLFYQTKYEKNFYLRNLKHRFWNHEVLVRVFIQNGWLTSNLADIAMKTFIKTIYHRVLESKLNQYSNKQNQSRHKRSNNKHNVKFSENFLHSFFVSYFCLDDIPKMYKQEINKKMNNNNNKYTKSSIISEETLRRWCELIELLASRGANINESEFKKVIPLQYALQLGKNTYKIISCTHSKKNNLLLPHSYQQENITVPDDIWNVLVSYL